MERISVSSSNIASVGWEDGILEVEFTNGGVYQYQGVPEDIYAGLMAAGWSVEIAVRRSDSSYLLSYSIYNRAEALINQSGQILRG